MSVREHITALNSPAAPGPRCVQGPRVKNTQPSHITDETKGNVGKGSNMS